MPEPSFFDSETGEVQFAAEAFSLVDAATRDGLSSADACRAAAEVLADRPLGRLDRTFFRDESGRAHGGSTVTHYAIVWRMWRDESIDPHAFPHEFTATVRAYQRAVTGGAARARAAVQSFARGLRGSSERSRFRSDLEAIRRQNSPTGEARGLHHALDAEEGFWRSAVGLEPFGGRHAGVEHISVVLDAGWHGSCDDLSIDVRSALNPVANVLLLEGSLVLTGDGRTETFVVVSHHVRAAGVWSTIARVSTTDPLHTAE